MSIKKDKKCMECNKNMRRIWNHKGMFLCSVCYRKKTNIMDSAYHKGKISLEEAQEKVRTILSVNKSGNGQLSLPSCYAGKKVKVIVVEDE